MVNWTFSSPKLDIHTKPANSMKRARQNCSMIQAYESCSPIACTFTVTGILGPSEFGNNQVIMFLSNFLSLDQLTTTGQPDPTFPSVLSYGHFRYYILFYFLLFIKHSTIEVRTKRLSRLKQWQTFYIKHYFHALDYGGKLSRWAHYGDVSTENSKKPSNLRRVPREDQRGPTISSILTIQSFNSVTTQGPTL